MKPAKILFTLIILVASAAWASDEIYHPESIGLTEEEMGRLHEIGMNHQPTAPPVGDIRNPAEWEPSEGVIIRYPFGIPYDLIAEYSNTLTLWTIVSSTSQKNSVLSLYHANGVDTSNCEFIIASTNTYWTRDYGPWFIFNGEELEIVDPVYNRPRPQDDVIPTTIGSQWSLPVYGMSLATPGGNHMSDGLGMSMSTELVYNENSGMTEQQVDDMMMDYLGNDFTVLDYIESGGIHHIDCWAKFLDPGTIMVKDVPTSSSSYHLLNARADQLSQQISAWGAPYEIVRIYCPWGTSYTNSIILNDKVFVPIFNISEDATALQTYADAMPGYQIIGFDGSWLDDDAIHCRAMGVPDRDMLRVHHMPLQNTNDTINNRPLSAIIQDCSGTGLIGDSLKIYYSVNGGAYTSIALTATADPDSFVGYIPVQAAGSEVTYFLRTADNSGRVEHHPYIGEPGAHSYEVIIINEPPEIAEISPQQVTELDTLVFSVFATDPDGPPPPIMAQNLPTNADFVDNGNGTGVFTFEPDLTQAGNHYPRFISSDGIFSDTMDVTVTVVNLNQPPVMTEVGAKDVDEGQALSFYVFASDPDGVDPSIDVYDAPANTTFDDYGDGTGRFVLTPDHFQEGVYPVLFVASDGEYADTVYSNITINDVNLPLSIVEPDSMFCRNTETFSFIPQILDDDDSVHTITYENYPVWLTVVNDTLTGTAPDIHEHFAIDVTAADDAMQQTITVNLMVFQCGNADGAGGVDIDDAVMLIAYIFGGGAEPYPVACGDADCLGAIDIDDVVYLISYIFSGGAAPCELCE